MNKINFLIFTFGLLSCGEKAVETSVNAVPAVTVSNDGSTVQFSDATSADYFKTTLVTSSKVNTSFVAPGRVIATIVPSVETVGQNLILFDNPELTGNYTALLQHLINIKMYTANLDRVKDLSQHGAATGREVIEAENQLANERTSILEHEAKLKLAGLEPKDLLAAAPSIAWVISDIPETQLENIKPGASCKLKFSSFPERDFTGKIEDWGSTVDPVTRTIKLRISVRNPSNQLKAGMFATQSFETTNDTWLTVPKEAIVTVQGKYYAFVKTGDTAFEKREIQPGDQVRDLFVIYAGIKENEKVVTSGTMQLKGIYFGY